MLERLHKAERGAECLCRLFSADHQGRWGFVSDIPNLLARLSPGWLSLQLTDSRLVYHSARNNFERFRFFFGELFSIFEFDFRRFENYYFFERFEFLARPTFNHTQCGRTCACAVACLHPHNYISNVEVSWTIHDDMYIYIGIHKRFAKKHETIVEGQRRLN